jgi:hypothetical protein
MGSIDGALRSMDEQELMSFVEVKKRWGCYPHARGIGDGWLDLETAVYSPRPQKLVGAIL